VVDKDLLKRIVHGTLQPKEKKKAADAEEQPLVSAEKADDSIPVVPDRLAPNGSANGAPGAAEDVEMELVGSIKPTSAAASTSNGISTSPPATQCMDNHKIACVHSALNPLKLAQVKLISPVRAISLAIGSNLDFSSH
jgi:hypothetical protein